MVRVIGHCQEGSGSPVGNNFQISKQVKEETALLHCHSCPCGPLSSNADLSFLASSEFTLGKGLLILFSYLGVSHLFLPSWGIKSLLPIKKSLEILFQGREASRAILGIPTCLCCLLAGYLSG